MQAKQYEQTALSNGILLKTYRSRVRRGWTKERASTEPTNNGWQMQDEHYHAAIRNGVNPNLYASRLKRGWSKEKASQTKTHEPMEYDKKFKAIAIENGISFDNYRYRLALGWSEEKASSVPVRHEYVGEIAVYKNDEILAMGTLEECVEITGYSKSYVRWLLTPSGQRRLAKSNDPQTATVAIKLD